MNEIHKFSRGGYDFVWTDGWCCVYEGDKKIFSSIDTHFKTDNDVYKFWKVFDGGVFSEADSLRNVDLLPEET